MRSAAAADASESRVVGDRRHEVSRLRTGATPTSLSTSPETTSGTGGSGAAFGCWLKTARL